MDERDGNRSFTDCRRDPLDVAGAHIANGEHPGSTGLQQVRWPWQWPFRPLQVFGREIRARLHESLRIERDAPAQPLSARRSARHHENVADVTPLGRLLFLAPVNPLEVPVSLESGDLGAGVQLYPRALLDTSYQVARHRLRESSRSDQHVNFSRCLRQEYRGLTGGVPAADDHDILARAELRLDEGRAVVHAGALELGNVVERQLSVLRTSGDDDGARRYVRPVVDLDLVRLGGAVQVRRALGDRNVGAELLGLSICAASQVVSRNPRWEAEVIFDARAGAGLAPGRIGLDDEHIQTFRRGIN